MSWYEDYLAQMQLPPEWSISKQEWQPLDSGWYEANQDYQRQAMQMMLDPMAGFMSGGFDPSALQDAVEEVEPAVTEGTDTLTRIVEQSDPRSPRRIVAAAILSGQSPEQAMQTLQGEIAAGSVDVNPSNSDEELKAISSFAQSAWEKRMGDREAVTRTVPNAAVQPFLDAGFTDPRKQFSADYINPELEAGRGQLAELEGAVPRVPTPGPTPTSGPGASAAARHRTRPRAEDGVEAYKSAMGDVWGQRMALRADEGRASNVSNLYETLYGTPFQMEAMQRSGMPMPEIPQGLFYETPSGPPPMRRMPEANAQPRAVSGGAPSAPPRPGPPIPAPPSNPMAAVLQQMGQFRDGVGAAVRGAAQGAPAPVQAGPFRQSPPQDAAAQAAAFERLFLRQPQADRRNMR